MTGAAKPRTEFSPRFNEAQQTWVWFLLLGDDQELDNGPAHVPKAIYDRLACHDLEGANWKAYRWRAAAEAALVLARCDHPPGGSAEAFRLSRMPGYPNEVGPDDATKNKILHG